jgi:ferritin-like metal-binding protein YciE
VKLDSLQALFEKELADLYSAETRLTKALPELARAAACPELRRAFEDHLGETQGHVARLTRVFEQLGEKPSGNTCKAMKGLISEGSALLHESGDPAVRDAGLIGAAQRVEHYEIAAYGCART